MNFLQKSEVDSFIMKWQIPAKTFLVGEYVALNGGPSLIVTTGPCFELSLIHKKDSSNMHKNSPAMRWWGMQNIQDYSLDWYDPYNKLGGLGASSAQFLGAFYATSYLEGTTYDKNSILDAYLSVAYSNKGIIPSGYDVLAQNMRGCVYLNNKSFICESHPWPFLNLSFILVHTGKKLATHEHLQDIGNIPGVNYLEAIANIATLAFFENNSDGFVDSINSYYQKLLSLGLVAKHSVEMIEVIASANINTLAIKGCGALGADILLLIVDKQYLAENINKLLNLNFNVVATSENLIFKQ
jgi:mevalonate kinase